MSADDRREPGRTHLLDILLRCRKGLELKDAEVPAVRYGTASLIMLFRHEDGRLYEIRISEIDTDPKKTPQGEET